MCPLYPIHMFIMYALVLGPVWFCTTTVIAQVATKTESWSVEFFPKELLAVEINEVRTVQVFSTDVGEGIDDMVATAVSSDDNIAKPGELFDKLLVGTNNWTAAFNVTGHFIGYAKMQLQLRRKTDNQLAKESNLMDVTVIRQDRVIDKVFVASVATLVSIIYINFGCALDMPLVKKMMRRPVGPGIGFVSQFVFMPLLSYGMGKLLFPGNAPMQLGLFFTGVSPSGGASNIWTVALNGNLHLSITMTTIGTFASFVTIPFWIFTLGAEIFNSGNIPIPYGHIASLAVSLVIPLGIGLLMQRYLPRVSNFMVRILKPFSAFLLIFIIVFAIVTNLYIFELFSWQIVIAGIGLPWLGFMFGMTAAWLFKQPHNDILAIAIETGVQNTGIAIFLLSALGQPEDDLTTVIPVSVAIMTPFPLMGLYIYRKCRGLTGEKVISDLQVNAEEGENISSLRSSVKEPFADDSVRKY